MNGLSMGEITIGEIGVKLDGHIALDGVRFEEVSRSLARVEVAILDHAKTAVETADRQNTRTHERMDGIVASISKVADKFDDGNKELHSRINSLLWSLLVLTFPVMGWLVVQLYTAVK